MHALTPALDTFITRMPKVELHLHLEGSIEPTTLLHIARRNKIDIPARDEAGVAQLFKYRNFHEFLTVFMALARSLIYGEDFEQIAYELGLQLAKQNIRYAEVMISPALYYNRGMDLNEVVQGVAAGFARIRREYGVQAVLAFDYGRQFGVETAWRVLEHAILNKHTVVAWSIGGDEINYPPQIFSEIYAAARKAGLHTMAHAGEVVGPPSVWGAVDVLDVERLGHGIRTIDDPTLIAYLRTRRVALDVCPTSNLCTGAVADVESHPLRRLYDAGLLVTLNSDDPIFFNTSLTEEYRLAVKSFGFNVDELVSLVMNGVRAAFLPLPERQAFIHAMEEEIKTLRAQLDL